MTILTLPYFILVTYIGYYMNTGTGVIIYDYVNIENAALPLLKEILKKMLRQKRHSMEHNQKFSPPMLYQWVQLRRIRKLIF